jgi:hypothetical protein
MYVFGNLECSCYESDEFWDVEVNIIEERCRQPVESRGIDSGQKLLRVFVYPFEGKPPESGEDRASWRKQTSVFLVRTRLRGVELKVKFFKAGQHGEASDHRLG